MEQISSILSKILNQPQVIGILILIVLDLATGAGAALKRGEFQWRKLADFYKTNFAPYFLVYLVAHTIGSLVQVNAETLGPTADMVSFLLSNSWAVVVYKVGVSVLANCQELGYKMNGLKTGEGV